MMHVEMDTAKKPQASRIGKVNVSFWIPPDERDKLKILAIKRGVTLQELLEAAAADLLKRKQ